MFITVLLVVIRKETYTLMRKDSDIFAFQRSQTFEGNGYIIKETTSQFSIFFCSGRKNIDTTGNLN